MAKKSGGKALEAKRRKNRRAQNLARMEELAAYAPLEAQSAVAVAEREPSTVDALAARIRHRITHPTGRRADWRTSLWVRILLCVLAPMLILYCCQLITLQEPSAVLAWFGDCAGAAWLTYFALLGVMVLLFSLTTSLFWSALLVGAPVLLLAFANHMKEVLNGVPVVVSDLTMLGRAGELTKFLKPGIAFGDGTWAALCIAVVLLLLIGVFACRQRKCFAQWQLRAGGGVLGLVMVALCLTLPTAGALLRGTGDEIQAERNDRLGLLAGFYSGYLDSKVQQPNAYNENNMNLILQAAKAKAAEAPAAASAVQPNVIMLMSESFCDPKVVLPSVIFQDDPIPNYRRLAKTFPTGDFLSNTYAGGTGNVEMEVMTGLPIAFLGSAEDLTALRDRTAYDRMPSVVKTFGMQGYFTEFVHAYNNRLYNRSDNLPTIGFDRVLFERNFPKDAERAGAYISDMALTEKLIYEFEQRSEKTPLFLFGLSMENHQPYFGQRYDQPSGLRFSASKLDEGGIEVVDNLIQGIHDADAALGALVEYFDERDEPTILVFWGDHLPGLNTGLGGDTLYSLLGYVKDDETKAWDSATMKKMHTTPYLVWNNYGAEFHVPAEMSTLALGTKLLDWAGVEKPLYYHWVDLALEDMLLYRQRLFVPTQGAPVSAPPADNSVAQDYRNLVYDIVYGRGYITAEMTRDPRASTQKSD